MKQWEPIAGSDIKPGDKISWGRRIFYGEVRYVSQSVVYWIPGSMRYADTDAQFGDISSVNLSFISTVCKLVEYTEYDPKQQPYTDDDI